MNDERVERCAVKKSEQSSRRNGGSKIMRSDVLFKEHFCKKEKMGTENNDFKYILFDVVWNFARSIKGRCFKYLSGHRAMEGTVIEQVEKNAHGRGESNLGHITPREYCQPELECDLISSSLYTLGQNNPKCNKNKFNRCRWFKFRNYNIRLFMKIIENFNFWKS